MARSTTSAASKPSRTTKPATTSRATSARQIEAKALASEKKSAGMRMLFENGYTVTQVAKVFMAPYGFVYGVAQRGGYAEQAANRRVVKATPAKATNAGNRARQTRAAARTTKAPATKAVTKPTTGKASQTKKASSATKPGRPSPARRAANRAPRPATR